MTQAHPLTVQDLKSHFDDPFQRGSCENVTHAAEISVSEGTCVLRVEAALAEEGELVDLWWDGDGCAWCEGQMSVVAESIRSAIADGTVVTKGDAIAVATETRRVVEGLLGGVDTESSIAECYRLPLKALQLCLETPVAEIEDDLADGSKFGGPSLREEC